MALSSPLQLDSFVGTVLQDQGRLMTSLAVVQQVPVVAAASFAVAAADWDAPLGEAVGERSMDWEEKGIHVRCQDYRSLHYCSPDSVAGEDVAAAVAVDAGTGDQMHLQQD